MGRLRFAFLAASLTLSVAFLACKDDAADPAADPDGGSSEGGADGGAGEGGADDAGPDAQELIELDAGPEPVGLVLEPPSVTYSCLTDVHVDPQGNDDTNYGTRASPYLTIGKALTGATAGTCVRVHAGTYSPTEPITFPTDGTAPSPIVLLSDDGPGAATIDGANNTTGSVIEITKDYNIVDGFVITRPETSTLPLVRFDGTYAGKGVGSVLRRSKLTGGWNHVKVYRRTSGVLVEYNELYGFAGNAPLSATGGSGMIFRGNNCHDWDSGENGSLQVAGGSTNVLVERNLFQNVKTLAGTVSFGEACDDTCDEDPEHYAVVNGRAINNLFIRVTRPFDVRGCKGCSLLANTILDSGRDNLIARVGWIATNGVEQPAVNLRLLNNIVSSPRAYLHYVVQIDPGASAGMQMDYNLYWNGPLAVIFGESRPSGADYNSLQANPLLRGQSDFRPSDGSYAIANGVDLSAEVTHDYVGTPRPAGPQDIGAFQH